MGPKQFSKPISNRPTVATVMFRRPRKALSILHARTRCRTRVFFFSLSFFDTLQPNPGAPLCTLGVLLISPTERKENSSARWSRACPHRLLACRGAQRFEIVGLKVHFLFFFFFFSPQRADIAQTPPLPPPHAFL